MLDINQYTYTKDPFTKERNYEIHPLNDLGHVQYVQKDAHTHVYLDKLNPRKMRQIYDEMKIKQSDQDELVEGLERYGRTNLRSQTASNPEKPSNAHNEDPLKATQEEVFDSEKLANGNFQINDADRPAIEGNAAHARAKSRPVGHDHFSRSQMRNTFNSFKPMVPLDEKLARFGYESFMRKDNPYLIHNPRLFKNARSKGKKSRFGITEEEYLNQSESFRNRPVSQVSHREKTGFESYNVPIVKRKQNVEPIPSSQFNQKCYKSVSGFDMTSNGEKESLLKRENERLKGIFLSQINDGFLAQNKLPRISYIVNQPNILVKKTGIGNSKFMGLRYNPHNFNVGGLKYRQRNKNGAILLN